MDCRWIINGYAMDNHGQSMGPTGESVQNPLIIVGFSMDNQDLNDGRTLEFCSPPGFPHFAICFWSKSSVGDQFRNHLQGIRDQLPLRVAATEYPMNQWGPMGTRRSNGVIKYM